ncbi:uncharacterized protein MG328 homolog [Saccostrea cucullata]|uniref:uncharacterized protein MG328 homolog n=1 Tax=Saccostrea cuccullata TaxID=36930 RepID=UPI002ED2CC20
MRFHNPFYITILLFLFNVGDGSALLIHGNSTGSDTIHGSGGHSVDVAEIKQIVLNLTAEIKNLKRQTEIIPVLKQNLTVVIEQKKLLQNRVFFLEAELNKLNASKPPSNDEFMAYLRSTKQIVQTLAANEEYDKNLTLRLNEAENNIAITEKHNKNLTKQLDNVVNDLVINEKQNENFTAQINEVENILVKYDKQMENVTKRLDKIHILLTVNEEYDRNLTLRLNEAEKSRVICEKQNKNLTEQFDEVVNKLMTNEEQDKNITQRLNEVVNGFVNYDKQGKNVTQRLDEMRNNLTANEEYDKNLTSRLTDVMNNLHGIKVQMRYTSLSLMDVHSKTDKLNTTLTTHFDDQIRDVYGRITNITKKVAFTVGVTSTSTTWDSGTLVFDRIVYNIGGGYDSSTGVFTSPVDGHFVFFVNVQSYSTYSMYTYIVLNGSAKVTTLVYNGGNESYDAGPNLVVLRLIKGDQVWVKYYTGTGYYTQGDAPVTTFSGFLI